MKKEAREEFVDQLLAQRLAEMGLTPQHVVGGIETGCPGLRLTHGLSEAMKTPFSRTPRVFGSVEINAALEHPRLGRHTISDMISTEAPTPEEALTRGVEAYLAVTFPALRALVDEAAYAGPDLDITTKRVNGETAEWKVFTGECQMLQDVTGEVMGHLQAGSPLAVIQDTLIQVLNIPRLHWCKLYGARTARGLSLGCIIDGRKSPAAEAEMRRRFGIVGPARAKWEYRQFFAMYPSAEQAPSAEPET